MLTLAVLTYSRGLTLAHQRHLDLQVKLYLKLMKYLGSTVGQETLSGLAVPAIDNIRARNLDLSSVNDFTLRKDSGMNF